MSRLPIVDAKTMEKLLKALGFENTRHKGSHAFYRHADGRTTTLPHHPGRDLSRPLIREILREIEQSPEEFQKDYARFDPRLPSPKTGARKVPAVEIERARRCRADWLFRG